MARSVEAWKGRKEGTGAARGLRLAGFRTWGCRAVKVQAGPVPTVTRLLGAERVDCIGADNRQALATQEVVNLAAYGQTWTAYGAVMVAGTCPLGLLA